MGKKDNGFLLFYDWKAPFEALSGDDCKKILMAMFDYARDGTEPPEFEGMAQMAACFIFPAMKRRKESVENGSKGGYKKAENAAAKVNVDNVVENNGDNTDVEGVNDTVYPPTTPLLPPQNDAATTRQDIDKDKTRTINKTINKTIDEDEDYSGTAADVSSVVGLATSICDWIDYPTVLTRELCQRIEGSGYDYEDYRRLFEVANECDFLKGKGGRGWKASLEWLIEHMYEVTSGKYRAWDKPTENASSSFDTDEFFEAALRRSYGADFKLNTEDKEQ
jgi:hypothetical protein